MSVMTAVTVGTALMGMSNARKMRKQSARQAAQALEERQAQQARVDEEVANYRAMKFTNPYANMENPFAENVYEDLTVNQQQAQFQAQQGAQQRADILASLRGAAGTSGIAGLAQTLANQGQLQAQQISASIGQQEAANQRLAAQGALQVQKGAYMADMAERGGRAMVQQAESGRQATILGMQLGQSAGANLNYQQSLLNQRNARIQANQMMLGSMQSLAGLDFGGTSSGVTSSATNTGGTFNPYEMEIDYLYNQDKPIVMQDPNPPALTSIGNIGSTASSYTLKD